MEYPVDLAWILLELVLPPWAFFDFAPVRWNHPVKSVFRVRSAVWVLADNFDGSHSIPNLGLVWAILWSW